MRMETILEKLKEKTKLREEEITYVVNGFTDGTISDSLMSKFLLLVKDNGLTYEETFYLTKAMVNSGEILDLSSLSKVVVDKHSTGGVGDKVTLIVAPIVACANIGVAKMSGRSLGFTGGTIDKLESIPGYKVNITNEEFIDLVNKNGISIISATKSLAPADKKIYALRDEIGAVESIPLIASSIMSKKIASGASYIVIDLKVGKGAFMKDVESATKLAEYMIEIGKYFNLKVVCILTDMNYPLGRTIGNALEVKEASYFFLGKREPRLEKLIRTISSEMISLGLNTDITSSLDRVDFILKMGQATSKFKTWITSQGGKLNDVHISDKKLEIISNEDGFVNDLDPIKLAHLVSDLGAGRKKKEDTIDLSVGIYLNKTINEEVKKGDILATVYYNKEIPDIEKRVLSSYKIESIKSEVKDIIISVIK